MLAELTYCKDIKDWTMEDADKLDDHLWENLKKTLADIFQTSKFRGEHLNDSEVRERVTRHSRMEEFFTANEGEECSPGIVKGLKEIKSYTTDLVEALEERFGDDFRVPFTKEIKDVHA